MAYTKKMLQLSATYGFMALLFQFCLLEGYL